MKIGVLSDIHANLVALEAVLASLGSDDALCHGGLRDPLWEYVTSERAAAASLALARTSHCCAGHTHVPALFPASGERIGHVRYGDPYPLGARAFFNPGSVGQPRDGD